MNADKRLIMTMECVKQKAKREASYTEKNEKKKIAHTVFSQRLYKFQTIVFFQVKLGGYLIGRKEQRSVWVSE